MSEDSKDDNKLIIYSLSLAIIAFFAYLIYKSSQQQIQPIQPVSNLSGLYEQKDDKLNLIESKLQELQYKIDNFNELKNAEIKTVSLNSNSTTSNGKSNIVSLTGLPKHAEHKLIRELFDMK